MPFYLVSEKENLRLGQRSRRTSTDWFITVQYRWSSSTFVAMLPLTAFV